MAHSVFKIIKHQPGSLQTDQHNPNSVTIAQAPRYSIDQHFTIIDIYTLYCPLSAINLSFSFI